MSFLIPTALADPMDTACSFIGGCEQTTDDVASIGLTVVEGLLSTAGAATVLFIVWGGMQMAFSGGDDSKIARGRMTVIYSIIGLMLALLSQSIVKYFIERARDIRNGSDSNLVWNAIAVAIREMLLIFNVAVVIVIIFAGYKYVLSRGNEDQAQGAIRMVLWAVIGGVVINTARIMAQLVFNTGI